MCFDFFPPGTGNDLGDTLVQPLHSALTETQSGQAKTSLEGGLFSQHPPPETVASKVMAQPSSLDTAWT